MSSVIGLLLHFHLILGFVKVIFLLLGVGAGYWSAAKQLRAFLKNR